jgi:hypothetical protein
VGRRYCSLANWRSLCQVSPIMIPLELSRNRFDVRQSACQLTISRNYRQGHGRHLDPLLFDIWRLCTVFTLKKKIPDLEFLTTVHRLIWYTYSKFTEDATTRIRWRWRQQTLPKIWLLPNRLHGVTTQKTVILWRIKVFIYSWWQCADVALFL